MHKKSAIIIIIIFLGVIVVGALLITRQIRIQSPVVFLDEPQQIFTDDQGTAIKQKDALVAVEIDTRTEREKVLDQYGDKVLAFDAECQVYPHTMSIPVRTVVVLNNRSSYERTIAIGPRNYVVAAENYSLATNNQAGSFVIACDDHAQGKLEVTE